MILLIFFFVVVVVDTSVVITVSVVLDTSVIKKNMICYILDIAKRYAGVRVSSSDYLSALVRDESDASITVKV